MPSINTHKMALRRYSRYIKTLFFVWDIILLNAAYLFSYLLRFGNFERFAIKESQAILLISNVIWIVLVIFYDAYKFIRVEHIEKIIARSIKFVCYHLVIIFAIIVLLKYHEISRFRLCYFYGTLFIVILFSRILALQLLKYFRKNGFNHRNIVIIGADKTGCEIFSFLSKDLAFGYKVLGFFDDRKEIKDNNVDVLGSVDQVKEFASNNPVHEIYYTLPDYSSEKVKDIIDFCESNLIRIKFVPDFKRFTKNRRVYIDFYGNIPVISLRKEPLEKPTNRIIKRLFDIIFSSLVILLILTWLFPILYILIRFSSKGPVFFKQSRSGEDNHSFVCWKFRTMQVNSDADSLQASKNDKRITKLGRFMRKTNLDEIPQFFNVLIGNMSVIGPRPHMLKHTEKYSALIKNYLVRHFAKPGITGWSQVNGLRGETKELVQMEKRIEFDIWYIENWSFLLDLKIVLKTIFNMFKSEKNAG